MTKTLLQGLWSFRFFQYRCFDEKSNSFSELERPFFEIIYGFRIWNFGHWNLFDICDLIFVIFVFPGSGVSNFLIKCSGIRFHICDPLFALFRCDGFQGSIRILDDDPTFNQHFIATLTNFFIGMTDELAVTAG